MAAASRGKEAEGRRLTPTGRPTAIVAWRTGGPVQCALLGSSCAPPALAADGELFRFGVQLRQVKSGHLDKEIGVGLNLTRFLRVRKEAQPLASIYPKGPAALRGNRTAAGSWVARLMDGARENPAQ